jgi:hypothetical protein
MKTYSRLVHINQGKIDYITITVPIKLKNKLNSDIDNSLVHKWIKIL